jgi:hypothetical protein
MEEGKDEGGDPGGREEVYIGGMEEANSCKVA